MGSEYLGGRTSVVWGGMDGQPWLGVLSVMFLLSEMLEAVRIQV